MSKITQKEFTLNNSTIILTIMTGHALLHIYKFITLNIYVTNCPNYYLTSSNSINDITFHKSSCNKATLDIYMIDKEIKNSFAKLCNHIYDDDVTESSLKKIILDNFK